MFSWWRRTTSNNSNRAFTFSGSERTEEADAARTWKDSHVDQANLRAALTFSQSIKWPSRPWAGSKYLASLSSLSLGSSAVAFSWLHPTATQGHRNPANVIHTSEPQGPESQMEEGGDLEGQMENVCNKEVCRFLCVDSWVLGNRLWDQLSRAESLLRISFRKHSFKESRETGLQQREKLTHDAGATQGLSLFYQDWDGFLESSPNWVHGGSPFHLCVS